jgi:uncharacterized protein YqhQ
MNMKEQNGTVQVGGQAVIEGVMMRSPHAVAVAVRKPSGEILIKKEPYQSLTQRYRWLNVPLIRGAIVLFETVVLGIRALSFSGDVALEEDSKEKTAQKGPAKGKFAAVRMAVTIGVAFALALGLFFYLPLILTEWLGVQNGFWFNVVDGGIRLLIFLAYLFAITMLKDIRRIFQYHGAEHKSIFAFENGLDLSVPNAQKFSTLHPRCGTSFLLFVMVVSVLVFIFLGRPEGLEDRLIRLLFVPLIGGISYELIRLSGKYSHVPVFSWLVAPGLWLQRITTREPTDDQVEVAIAALQAAVSEDFSQPIEIIEANHVRETGRN